jgi:hypothetical protein
MLLDDLQYNCFTGDAGDGSLRILRTSLPGFHRRGLEVCRASEENEPTTQAPGAAMGAVEGSPSGVALPSCCAAKAAGEGGELEPEAAPVEAVAVAVAAPQVAAQASSTSQVKKNYTRQASVEQTSFPTEQGLRVLGIGALGAAVLGALFFAGKKLMSDGVPKIKEVRRPLHRPRPL